MVHLEISFRRDARLRTSLLKRRSLGLPENRFEDFEVGGGGEARV